MERPSDGHTREKPAFLRQRQERKDASFPMIIARITTNMYFTVTSSSRHQMIGEATPSTEDWSGLLTDHSAV